MTAAESSSLDAIHAFVQRSDLRSALGEATRFTKSAPTNPSARTTLFELLCFSGEFERAAKQLEVLGHLDPELQLAVGGFDQLLAGERARREVLRGAELPGYEAVDAQMRSAQLALLDAVRSEASGSDLTELVARCEEHRPRLAGTLNGEPIHDFRDGDDLLAPVLEVLVGRHYVWVDLRHVASLVAEAPTRLRDLFWVPVTITSFDGEEMPVHVPALYAGSETSDDDAIRLGNATSWVEDRGVVRGLGRRVFYHEDGEIDVLAIRELELHGVE